VVRKVVAVQVLPLLHLRVVPLLVQQQLLQPALQLWSLRMQ
jgi:hypothetical protein